MPRSAAVRSLLAVAVALTGCDGGDTPEPKPLKTEPGVAIGAPATGTFGAGGGTLASSDGGLVLTIPPGALSADTELSVTPVSAPASNAVWTYLLEPAGTAFGEPVTLTFDAADAGAGLSFLGVALHQDAGTWRFDEKVARDEAAHTVAVGVSHFSEYSLLRGYQLQPLGAAVEVGGEQRFEIVACAEPSTLAQINGESLGGVEDDPDLLLYECLPVYFPNASADDWSVDGAPGGDRAKGTIEPEGPYDATFHAPAKKPDPDVVAISTRFTYGESVRGKALRDVLVARATITDDVGYAGTFTVDAKGPYVDWTGTGTATWTKNPDSPLEYRIDGTVRPDRTEFRLGGDTCTIAEAEVPFTFDAGNIKEIGDRATVYWGITSAAATPTSPGIEWDATCCDDSGHCVPVPRLLSLVWASGCAAEWAPLDPDEWSQGNLMGSYTWPNDACGQVFPGVPTAGIDWYFPAGEY